MFVPVRQSRAYEANVGPSIWSFEFKSVGGRGVPGKTAVLDLGVHFTKSISIIGVPLAEYAGQTGDIHDKYESDPPRLTVVEESHAMAILDRTCPYCGAAVHQGETPIWDANGFPCPACGQRLRTRRRSLKLTWAITLPCAVGLSLLFGLRGWNGLFVCLGISVPLSFVIHSILGVVFPPPLDAFRGERQGK
jgi:hypothetical protein